MGKERLIFIVCWIPVWAQLVQQDISQMNPEYVEHAMRLFIQAYSKDYEQLMREHVKHQENDTQIVKKFVKFVKI